MSRALYQSFPARLVFIVPKISILPSSLADQIAAGEVVERPASVVKELVENSLDAGAKNIDITVEEGGRKLIRVSDDGCGMDREDAELALARHGTSKIKTASDLAAICSYGFRGEALPAIASVSRLDVETSVDDASGTTVRAAAGAILSVSDSARRRGTTISVSNIFYNTPARLKFLRSARSEWRSIMDALTSVALASRDVRISVTHDKKQVMSLAPAADMRSRIAEIWGARYAESLVMVDDVQGPVHVTGLVDRPANVGTATRRVFLSVNGRAIRDTGLTRAAELAFKSTISAGLRPSLFLELTVPVDMVDVNVHPAKAEVRFRDRWGTERVVEGAVRKALGTVASAAALGGRSYIQQSYTPITYQPNVPLREIISPRASEDSLFSANAPSSQDVPEDTFTVAPSNSLRSEENIAVPQIPLVQLRRTYIMFEHEEGVVLIDQHSAHERILFEEFMRMLESGSAPSQRLLLPLTLHLGPGELEALDENREYLEKLGFEIDKFGGYTIIVNSVPAPHPRFDAEKCLRETLQALTGDRVPGTAAKHEKLASTVACKAAVKAGDKLSYDEMRALVTKLGSTDLPAHDVHGRSTIVHLTWNELERRFGRA